MLFAHPAPADAALAAGARVTGVIPTSLVNREIAHQGLHDLQAQARALLGGQAHAVVGDLHDDVLRPAPKADVHAAGGAADKADLELYDYQADPAETRNLAAAQITVVKELRAILARHPEAKAPR